MTRDEAMLKLLTIEPERLERIVQITGWGRDETIATLRRLELAGQISSISTFSVGEDHRTYFVPGIRDESLQQLRQQRQHRAERAAEMDSAQRAYPRENPVSRGQAMARAWRRHEPAAPREPHPWAGEQA